MKLNDIKPNERNPRYIKADKLEKLKQSIKNFEKMMALRPIVVDETNTILGGNMRYNALKSLGYKEIPNEWVKRAENLTEDEKRRFIIEDNVGFGEWDWDMLANEWDASELEEWGLDLPIRTETEKLSKLEYNGCYYEPIEKPNIKLKDCVNLEKFNAKIDALNEYELTEQQKEILKMFAYRFIKIDFENVANYYAFNASEEEKKAIERLRLVLVDNGINGFIEDDMLRVCETFENYEDD